MIITAGPTREPLDPVRFISNYSTGKMGYALAEQAVKRGIPVKLISGPVRVRPPEGVKLTSVETAQEMFKAVNSCIKGAFCVIMAAAVCDYRPVKEHAAKIKKAGQMELKLVRTPDILNSIKREQGVLKVGFALETDDPVGNAKKKLKDKCLDMIVLNRKAGGNDPFGEGDKEFSIYYKHRAAEEVPPLSKDRMADLILDRIRDISGEDACR
jgi:phosphopantothenoylcysteine decarboxylase/phosphopantothenate--cysteine ligase